MRRLLQFRNELVILWRAFLAPETPAWLKGLMLLIPAYLLSPIDLIPDFIPVVGWLSGRTGRSVADEDDPRAGFGGGGPGRTDV